MPVNLRPQPLRCLCSDPFPAFSAQSRSRTHRFLQSLERLMNQPVKACCIKMIGQLSVSILRVLTPLLQLIQLKQHWEMLLTSLHEVFEPTVVILVQQSVPTLACHTFSSSWCEQYHLSTTSFCFWDTKAASVVQIWHKCESEIV